MSIIASLKPIIRLLLMASYAAYCVIGLACIVLGAYYAGAIDGAFTSVITVTILSGLLMLMIILAQANWLRPAGDGDDRGVHRTRG